MVYIPEAGNDALSLEGWHVANHGHKTIRATSQSLRVPPWQMDSASEPSGWLPMKEDERPQRSKPNVSVDPKLRMI